jgi:hypothetical protein
VQRELQCILQLDHIRSMLLLLLQLVLVLQGDLLLHLQERLLEGGGVYSACVWRKGPCAPVTVRRLRGFETKCDRR